jgi:precorrin-6A/cobalt-precorrin-6A reductase
MIPYDSGGGSLMDSGNLAARITPLRVLVLGGTADGRALGDLLSETAGFTGVSSLAGRTASPLLPKGEVRIGGFGGVEGLIDYLRDNGINAVVDATHPFAAQMTAHAAEACRHLGVPLAILHRHAWKRVEGDRWVEVSSIGAAAEVVESVGRRVFLTIGRQELAPFAPLRQAWFLIRSIDPPTVPLPAMHQLLLDRGPFTVERELDLVRSHGIDAIVSKNSGGQATYGKIAAARQLGLPVVMVQQPLLPDAPVVESPQAAMTWLQQVLR